MARKAEMETWRVIRGDANRVGDGEGNSMLTTGATSDADLQELDGAWAKFEQRAVGENPHVAWSTPSLADEAWAQPNSQTEALDQEAHSLSQAQRPPMQSRKGRPAVSRLTLRIASAGAAAAVAIGFLFTGWGNAVLADMFQMFTVQHLTVANPNDLQTLENALTSLQTSGKALKLDQFGEVSATPVGNPTTTTLQQAGQQLGVTLPALPGADTSAVNVRGGTQVTFRIHVDAVNGLLQQLGGTVSFPQSVDSQPIVVQTSPIALESTPNGSQELVVTKVPQLKVPSTVDVNQVRAAMLSLPFLPSDIRSDLASTTTWSNTLVLPNRGNLQDTTVDGHDAVVDATKHRIMWLKNGVVYSLRGTSAAFPSTAALIRAAQELDT